MRWLYFRAWRRLRVFRVWGGMVEYRKRVDDCRLFLTSLLLPSVLCPVGCVNEPASVRRRLRRMLLVLCEDWLFRRVVCRLSSFLLERLDYCFAFMTTPASAILATSTGRDAIARSRHKSRRSLGLSMLGALVRDCDLHIGEHRLRLLAPRGSEIPPLSDSSTSPIQLGIHQRSALLPPIAIPFRYLRCVVQDRAAFSQRVREHIKEVSHVILKLE